MHATLLLLSIPTVIAVSALWRGWVLTKLWTWFICPTFGAVELALPAAIGITIIASYLAYQHRVSNKGDSQGVAAVGEAISVAAVYPAIVLLIGWITSFFM